MNIINNNLVNYNMNNCNGISNKYNTVITNVVHELNNLKDIHRTINHTH